MKIGKQWLRIAITMRKIKASKVHYKLKVEYINETSEENITIG